MRHCVTWETCTTPEPWSAVAKGCVDALATPGKRGHKHHDYICEQKPVPRVPAEPMSRALLAGRVCWHTLAEALLQPCASCLLY